MGNCGANAKLGYEELRNSVVGSLIANTDFDYFYSLCRVETVRTVTTVLSPSPDQLFFVLISGKVVVHLSSPDVPNVCATTFNCGDMIHFFNCPLNQNWTSNAECISNGEIKVTIHFQGYTQKMGRVIGMDRSAFETFMKTRSTGNKQLKDLMELNLSSFIPRSIFFHSMTAEQVSNVI